MRYFLLVTTLYLSSTSVVADVMFKTCSRSPRESATVTLDEMGAFHITLNLGKETFVSATCKPLIPIPISQIGIVSIECSGAWSNGKGSVILDSMDGVLNALMYKGPESLPAQYDDGSALFCGAVSR